MSPTFQEQKREMKKKMTKKLNNKTLKYLVWSQNDFDFLRGVDREFYTREEAVKYMNECEKESKKKYYPKESYWITEEYCEDELLDFIATAFISLLITLLIIYCFGLKNVLFSKPIQTGYTERELCDDIDSLEEWQKAYRKKCCSKIKDLESFYKLSDEEQFNILFSDEIKSWGTEKPKKTKWDAESISMILLILPLLFGFVLKLIKPIYLAVKYNDVEYYNGLFGALKYVFIVAFVIVFAKCNLHMKEISNQAYSNNNQSNNCKKGVDPLALYLLLR